jgi:hypothetical protein
MGMQALNCIAAGGSLAFAGKPAKSGFDKLWNSFKRVIFPDTQAGADRDNPFAHFAQPANNAGVPEPTNEELAALGIAPVIKLPPQHKKAG